MEREIRAIRELMYQIEQRRGVVPSEVLSSMMDTMRRRLKRLELGGGTTTAAAPSTHYRPVTVFAVRLSMTNFAGEGRLRPRMAEVQLNRAIEAVTPVVERLGGAYFGVWADRLMYAFGAPSSSGDDARQALLAAADALSVLFTQGRSRTMKLPTASVGVASGVVLGARLGPFEHRPYTLFGTPWVTAWEISEMADEGEIYVDPETAHVTERGFEFEKVNDVALRYIRERTRQRPVRATINPLGVFLGRDREFDQLEEWAADEARRRLVVMGPEGVGKSRLLLEFRDGLQDSERWAFAESGIHADTAPFSFVRDLIQVAIPDLVFMDEQERSQRLDAEGFPLLTHVFSLVGIDDPPTEGGTFLYELIRTFGGFVERFLSKFVLVIDRAHRLDRDDMLFVDELKRLAARRILRLVEIHTVLPADEPGFAESMKAEADVLLVRDLTLTDAEELVRSLPVGASATPDQRRRITRLSLGNPLLAKYTLHADGEVVVPVRPESSSDENLWSTVLAEMARRIGTGERLIVNLLCVAGEPVSASLINEVLRRLGVALDVSGLVESLISKDIIRRTRDDRLVPAHEALLRILTYEIDAATRARYERHIQELLTETGDPRACARAAAMRKIRLDDPEQGISDLLDFADRIVCVGARDCARGLYAAADRERRSRVLELGPATMARIRTGLGVTYIWRSQAIRVPEELRTVPVLTADSATAVGVVARSLLLRFAPAREVVVQAEELCLGAAQLVPDRNAAGDVADALAWDSAMFAVADGYARIDDWGRLDEHLNVLESVVGSLSAFRRAEVTVYRHLVDAWRRGWTGEGSSAPVEAEAILARTTEQRVREVWGLRCAFLRLMLSPLDHESVLVLLRELADVDDESDHDRVWRIATAAAYISILYRRLGEVDEVETWTNRFEGVARELSDAHTIRALVRAQRGWIAYRRGDDAVAEEEEQAALTIMEQGVPTLPFRWLAALPLLGLAARRQDDRLLTRSIHALLAEGQQAMPEAIADQLRRVGSGGSVDEARRLAGEAGFV